MKMKKNLSLILLLISFSTFSQITFDAINITSGSFLPSDAAYIYSADLDNDGDMDIISVSTFDNFIAWYENVDGEGNFSLPKRISSSQNDGAFSIYASDLDNDGDLDILSASLYDNDIAWYENTDGNGNFGPLQIISKEGINARSVYASDIDNDGDMDVLSASNQQIAWHENIDGKGNFSAQKVISTSVLGAYLIRTEDIDMDGDLDVVSASQFDNKLAWYENTDGNGNFSSQKIITSNANFIYSFSFGDLDGDAITDISYTSATLNKIAWFKNTDGKGNFGNENIISTSASFVKSILNCDVDDDGDLDILATLNNKIVWYENTDGKGSFGNEKVISSNMPNSQSIYASDIDGDSDLDIIVDGSNNFFIFENTDGKGSFNQGKQLINSTYEARSVFACDIDGDGDLDVLTSSSQDDKVSWFENADGLGTFNKQKIIAYTNGAVKAIAGDIDGDGDLDIVATGHNSNRTFWQENLDGLGNFGTPRNIEIGTSFNTSIILSDIDNDGDLDLVSDAKWFENLDGLGNFGSAKTISFSVSQLYYTYASDIDGDGDLDILTASAQDDKIAWHENIDGKGDFGTQKIITINAKDATYVISGDVDGDGDEDVISASFGDKKIAWYENTDGKGNFGSQQVITTNVAGATRLFISDLDNDGDLDIVSASPSDNKIAWYENTDGKGNFGESTKSQKIISSNAFGAVDVFAADINNDGKLDLLSASFSDSKIAWYKNTSTILSTNTMIKDKLSIYPNPTDKILIFKTNQEIENLKIYNILGQEIKTFNQINSQVDVSKLNAGIYILQFSINKSFEKIKFIKL
jgi:hypothetical protein